MISTWWIIQNKWDLLKVLFCLEKGNSQLLFRVLVYSWWIKRYDNFLVTKIGFFLNTFRISFKCLTSTMELSWLAVDKSRKGCVYFRIKDYFLLKRIERNNGDLVSTNQWSAGDEGWWFLVWNSPPTEKKDTT